MIKRYASTQYLGPRQCFVGENIVSAHGTICGQRYECAEFYKSDQYPVGSIPPGFRETARLAFVRRYLKIRADR